MTRARPILLLAALLCAACASKYALRTTRSEVELQWPFPPLRAKLTYVESWTGLARTRSAGSRIGAFLSGKDRTDPDAFVLPVAVAKGNDGRVAVADLGRRCVHLYLPAESRYARLVGPEQARLASPVAVAFDEELRLYVSDSAGRVLCFDAEGTFVRSITSAGEQPLRRPVGLAYSPAKKLLYVVDTLAHAVHAFDSEGTARFSFGARGEQEGAFNFPTQIFRSAAGELYVTDALNFRIGIFDEEGAPHGGFGRHGDGSGDLAMPKGVAVDGDGVVYVVDGLFDNVQLFDRRGAFLLTLGRRGTDAGEFWLPAGAFIGPDRVLYVCDTYNRRIQLFRITEGYGDGSSS